MNVKDLLLENRLWITVAGVLLFSVFSVSAQCVVGGTNFDTGVKSLCSPATLTDNDDEATGWLSNDLDAILISQCGGSDSYHLPVTATQHLSEGLLNNVIWGAQYPIDKSISNQYTLPWSASPIPGTSAIVANPRMIHPYYVDRPDNNIFVSLGSAKEVPFFSYTVKGLKPGSDVTFEAEVFSLLSDWAYNFHKSQGVTDSELKYNPYNGGIVSYSLANITGGTDRMSVKIGSSLSAVTGGINPGGTINNGPAASYIDFGKSITLTWTGTANASGNITFYIARGNTTGNLFQIPIGLDNIVITGTPQPQITYFGEPCPMMPFTVNLKQTYPQGTTFSWNEAVTGTTGTSGSFIFEPRKADIDYEVTATVMMPGCSAVTSAVTTIRSKVCCEDGKGLPSAKVNLLYDDFGHFPDNDTYEYRDKYGVVHTMPIIGAYHCGGGTLCSSAWGGEFVPFAYPQLVSSADLGLRLLDPIGDALYMGGCVVSYRQPFYPGVTQDNSGTGRGGMLYFALGAVGKNDVILYKKQVDGLCQGKKIYFSAQFAAINRGVNADGYSNKVGELVLEVLDASTGTLLYSTENVVILGNAGWQPASAEFEMPAGVSSVFVQVRHIGWSRCGNNDVCDYAIDDILVQVCAPPNILVDATVTEGEVCNNPVTLKVTTSSTINDYYTNMGYLFQYSYDNPQTATNVRWYDLGTVGTANQYVISNPSNHPAFNRDKVYFRVVAGNQAYLINNRAEWGPMDVFSSCREVSISDPIVVTTNCPPCQVPSVPSTLLSDFCQGIIPPALPDLTLFGFASHQWYDSSMNPVSSISSTIASTPGIHNYDVTVTDNYGCVSDPLIVPVKVIANPAAPTINRDVIYYRADIQSNNVFLNLLQQDAGFLTQVPGAELLWSSDGGATWTITAPVPPTPDSSDFNDKTYFYLVKQQNILTPRCESQPATVLARIYLIPSPIVSSLSYCIGETADPLTAMINLSPGYTVADYELRWYADATSFTYSTTAPIPNTAVAGEMIYYVSQFNIVTYAESSRVSLTVTVSESGVCSSTSACTDPKALNYDPQNMDNNGSCRYADEENTYNGQVPETPVDTVGAKALENCDLIAGMPLSAKILKIAFTSKRTIIVYWEIVQGDNTFYYDVEYTISRSGVTLFYLSIVCDEALRASAADVTGHTVSAVYDVDFTTGICQPEGKTDNVVVYPNPFTDKLTVLVKGAEVTHIALYSIEGSLLATYRNLNEVQIATDKLPAGVYIVKVTADGKTETVTVVKN
jgi:hypothetical protein